MNAMNCTECRRHFSPFADGELDAGTQGVVQAHLRECPACVEYFAREQRFEEGLRARLSAEFMPDETWDDLAERVRSNRRIRKLPLVWPVALAASIGLIVLVGLYATAAHRGGSAGPAQVATASVVDLLQDATPELVPFAASAAANSADGLATLSKRVLGREVRIDPAGAHGHPVQFIDAREATDAEGHAFVELRLNCCGKPVLLALAADDSPCKVSELRCVTAEAKVTRPCRESCGKLTGKSKDVRYVSVERDGVRIAAAAAGHSPDAVLDAVRVKA